MILVIPQLLVLYFQVNIIKKKKKDKYEMNSEHVWLKHSTQHQWNHFSGY